MRKVLILEDNVHTLACLEQIVKECDNSCTVYSLTNLKDARECMLEHKVDLFIVDIILDRNAKGDASGLKFAESIRSIGHYRFVPLIFITSLMDSKFISYDKFHCYRFIEKPFDIQLVKETINDCMAFPGKNNQNKVVYFHKDGIILAIKLKEIRYAESMNHTLHIHTKKNDIIRIPYVTLKSFIQMVDDVEFVQCSRSTIVNLSYVKNIDMPNRIIQIYNGDRIEIGSRFKDKMKELF